MVNSTITDYYYCDSCRTLDIEYTFNECARWSATLMLLTKQIKFIRRGGHAADLQRRYPR